MIISGSRYYSEAELALRTAQDYRRATRRKGKLGEEAQVRSSLPEAPGAPTFQFFVVPWWSIFTSYPICILPVFTTPVQGGRGDLSPDNTLNGLLLT